MKTNFIVAISLFYVYGISCKTVKVSVYYEALCSDSVEFIEKQLFPTYKYIGNDIKVDLIPFGNAEVFNESGKLEFVCQHGPKECYGNKMHSCAVALYSVEESTQFVYCSMDSDDPSSNENLEKCANSSDISWSALERCYTSGQADKLLGLNGIRTRAVQPPIRFIPTIIFNDHFNQTLQDEAVNDFTQVVCKFLDYVPAVCNKYIIEVKYV